jgi:hypothetical protein
MPVLLAVPGRSERALSWVSGQVRREDLCVESAAELAV